MALLVGQSHIEHVKPWEHHATAPYHIVQDDDNISGTSSNDTILSGGGNDHVYAGAGNDTIDGGDGNDFISGASSAASHDVVGHWGHDVAAGGQGDDRLDFSMNLDSVTLYGDDAKGNTQGNDAIWGGHAGDFLAGGDGMDQIWGGDGDDIIYGGTPGLANFDGADVLDGGNGNDKIFGQDGDDIITGGKGDDVLSGGRGSDTFVFAKGDSGNTFAHHDVITDFQDVHFTGGEDRIDLGHAGTANNFTEGFFAINTNGMDGQHTFDAVESTAKAQLDAFGHRDYVFETNGKDGWLFTADSHNAITSAIELRGVTHLDYHSIA